MGLLHRHQLVYLRDEAWLRLQAAQTDPERAACVAHWAQHRLPVVVTRQAPEQSEPAVIALGLPAPLAWGRQRIAFSVSQHEILYFDEFPLLDKVLPGLAAPQRRRLKKLTTQLQNLGTQARVYGSYGWQQVSGLDHTHGHSDLDLWIFAPNLEQADAVAASLDAFADEQLRLDGELTFGDGSAVAWREWLAWRAGRTRSLLVKTLHGCHLVHTPDWRFEPMVAEQA